MSVFYYDIYKDLIQACQIAKETFDMAISDLDQIDQDSNKDTTLMLQLLRDNLTLWYSEMVDENGMTKPQYANADVHNYLPKQQTPQTNTPF